MSHRNIHENQGKRGGDVFCFFLRKKNRITRQFVLRKIKRYPVVTLFKAKISKHGKKKNFKDEIENILLKHVFTSL